MERTAAETVVHSSISLPHNDSIHSDSQTPVSRLKARRQPPLIVSKAAYLNYLLCNNPDGEKVSWVFREGLTFKTMRQHDVSCIFMQL